MAWCHVCPQLGALCFGAPRFVWKPNIADNSLGGYSGFPTLHCMRVSVLFIWYAILWLEAASWRVVTATVQTGSLHLFLDMLSPFSSNAFFLAVSLPFNFSFLLVLQLPEKEWLPTFSPLIFGYKVNISFQLPLYSFMISAMIMWLFILTSLCVCVFNGTKFVHRWHQTHQYFIFHRQLCVLPWLRANCETRWAVFASFYSSTTKR